MRCYIAGPMTGMPNYNAPEFDRVAIKLRIAGHEVYNPVDVLRDIYGTVENFQKLIDSGLDYWRARKQMLARELVWITLFSERIYLLPNWEQSTGAVAEHALAVALKLEICKVSKGLLL